jgi:4-diphosphocytidyl-2C-methyl-D-erythritol kinase
MDDTLAKLNSHEAVCAERYTQIQLRLDRLEKVIIWFAGVMITGMGGIIYSLLTHAK